MPGRILRVLQPQSVGDLFGAPTLAKPSLDLVSQDRVSGESALLGAHQTSDSHLVRGEWAIPSGLVTVAAHLPADRRRRPPQFATDGT